MNPYTAGALAHMRSDDRSRFVLKGRGVVDTYVYGLGIYAVSLEFASSLIGLIHKPFTIFEHQCRSLSIPLLQIPIKLTSLS